MNRGPKSPRAKMWISKAAGSLIRWASSASVICDTSAAEANEETNSRKKTETSNCIFPPMTSVVGLVYYRGVLERARAHRMAQHRSEEHTSELQSPCNLVCRLLLEKKNKSMHA